jgi:serine/threonine protein kinase
MLEWNLTADELRDIQDELERLLEPFTTRASKDMPAGAATVRILAYFLPEARRDIQPAGRPFLKQATLTRRRGGMSVVYLAQDLRLNRKVARKLGASSLPTRRRPRRPTLPGASP